MLPTQEGWRASVHARSVSLWEYDVTLRSRELGERGKIYTFALKIFRGGTDYYGLPAFVRGQQLAEGGGTKAVSEHKNETM